MKTITNGVYLVIDGKLKQVSEYNNEENALVAVVYGDETLVISNKNLGEMPYENAMLLAQENYSILPSKLQWVFIDSVLGSVKSALRLIGADDLADLYWLSTECNADTAWVYYGSNGLMYTSSKITSFQVRPSQAFPTSHFTL